MFSPKLSDNANVNLVELGERFIAMTETPIPVEFDAETLATAGVAYEVPGMLTTAHPHLDRASKGMLNYAAGSARATSTASSGSAGRGEPEVIARSPPRARLHALLRAHRALDRARRVPVRRQPAAPGAHRPPLHRELPLEARARDALHLFDRRRARLPAVRDRRFFGFHHVNAYEDGDDVVVDLCTFDDAAIVEDLYLERLRAGKPIAPAELRRFRIRPRPATVEHERLVDEPFELPRINYGRCNERPYRYAWGVGERGGWLDRIVSADVEERRRGLGASPAATRASRCSSPRPDADDEDDGVLLSVVLDGRKGTRSCSCSTPRPRGARPRRGAAPHPVRVPRALRQWPRHLSAEQRQLKEGVVMEVTGQASSAAPPDAR